MRRDKNGFTLAELLIVVAIIAVLVAISIPIFTTQLEKSRDAVSIANIRAAYAEASADYLTSADNGKGTTTAIEKEVELKGVKADDFSGLADQLPFTATSITNLKALDGTAGKVTLTFSWSNTGELTIAKKTS